MKFKKKKYSFSPPEKYRTGEALRQPDPAQGLAEHHRSGASAAQAEAAVSDSQQKTGRPAVLPLTPARTERLLQTVELTRAEIDRALAASDAARQNPAGADGAQGAQAVPDESAAQNAPSEPVQAGATDPVQAGATDPARAGEANPAGADGAQDAQTEADESAAQNAPSEPAPPKKDSFWRRLAAPGNLAFLLLALLLMGPVYLVNYAFGDLYYLYEGEEAVGPVFSTQADYEAIFAKAGLTLREADRVEEIALADSRSLYLTRAYPVQVTADGETVELYALDLTTAGALEQLGISLGPDDLVEPALDKMLEPGDEIVVQRVWYETREAAETVEWQEVDKPSPLIAEGKTQVMNAGGGRDGLVYRTYEDKYVDGELVQSEVIEETYEDFPWNVVTLVGDDDAVMSPIDGSKYTDVQIVDNAPESYERVLESAVCTAYSFKPGTYGASGMYMFQGFVAVNTNVIPYGSLLYITSPTGNFTYGWAIAADVGEAMMAGYVDIDLFFETYTESALFGKHRMNVYVVDQLTQSELEEFMAQPGMFRARVPED